ncbi:class I SAM-dependent DNA methyltransferase [Algihabitans albus]|uniref:type I restriction-modification system subunit M n=1 Tax=Algihabitans albus TaxID=2164067 RepID=UPI0035CFCFCF
MTDAEDQPEAALVMDKKELGIDPEALWAAADKLRGSIDAAEYKHVVLGLIFLKYISDAFETRREALRQELEADGITGASAENMLESRDEYTAESVFWVPVEARWAEIQAKGKTPNIGKLIDEAMYAIERDNPKLKGKLPRDYARRGISPERLGGLIDQIASIAVGTKEAQKKDILGRVYEYFLGKFAAAEGKLGGEFFTPSSIVRLMVEMIEPYEGRVYDPACGSGGMFVQSERFAEAHGGSKRDLSVFGQESNPTTWRLAHMNLAIRGIEANLGEQPADSFTRDLHPDLKADYILANPPFNISDWSGDLLRSDTRWKYGPPPVSNANYAWIQHFIHHLSPPNGKGGGIAAFVMANGSLSSTSGGEGEIRTKIIEADLVDCIIAMPPQLFLTTGIPVCLWFVTRDKSGKHLDKGRGGRDRSGETLFIDARDMGALEEGSRTLRFLSGRDHPTSPPPPETEIGRIVRTYHAWRGEADAGDYEDVKGFCKAATLEEIAKRNHVLTPGTYVGSAALKEDDEPFAEKMERLVGELSNQLAASDTLTGEIRKNLGALGHEF